MEFRKEDMIDLNEQNVQKLFAYCLANDSTPLERIAFSCFIEENKSINVPVMKFDKAKVVQETNKLIYLFGQLRAIHIGTASMIATDGFLKYDGTTWTQNKVALFALFYLGEVSSLLYKFTYYPSSKNFATPLNLKAHLLKPTLSPNDPNFK